MFLRRFKSNFGSKLFTATQLCINLVSYSRLMLVQSSSTVPNTIENFIAFPFFSHIPEENSAAINGKIISEENSAAINGINNEPFCIYCQLKNQNSDYSLPCR